MPVYNEETFNYEILLRFGDSGPNRGKLTGASRTTITQTTKDGVPIGGGTNINPPQQLALIAGEEGEMLTQVLGEVNMQTIIQNQILTAAVVAANQETDALNIELEQAEQQKALLAEQLVEAKAEIKVLNGRIELSATSSREDAL